MTNIPYGRQYIPQEDIDAVVGVLKSDFLTQGPVVAEFEKTFAKYIGCKYAVAVANGTAALHISCLALGVTKESKVVTTPLTFAASANCVRFCGGKVIFSDIDEENYLLDLSKLEKLLDSDKDINGIIPVDFAGYPVNAEELRVLADKYGCWILEDACHAPGGSFQDTKENYVKCGDGVYSDLSIFSFHPVKHIACGEGGMITTNSSDLYDKLCLLRSHGITKDPNLLEENHGGWYYEMQELGYNYRLSDIHAALGLAQMKRAEWSVRERKQIAERYDEAFENTTISTPKVAAGYNHAYHLYVIQVEDRRGLYEHLRSNKVYSQIHYEPVHLQPYYKKLGWEKGDMPVVEDYYDKCLSLPMYPTLTEEEQLFVIEQILEFVK